MNYIFEGIFLLIGSAMLSGATIVATIFTYGNQPFSERDKTALIRLFAVSGFITLVFGARMLYLLSLEAGYTMF